MWSEAAKRQIASWGGLSEADAERVGMFEVEDASLVYADFLPLPAIVIPYFDAAQEPMAFTRDGVEYAFCRVRYLAAPAARAFGSKKPQRYGQPKASGTRAYFSLLTDWVTALADTAEPLLITEGEAKGLAAAVAGLPCIALGGVYNWLKDGELLPELAAINWRGRDTYIIFDSDREHNPNILAAEARLVEELGRRGAQCYLIQLPQDGDEKEGLDTFLEKHGAQAIIALLQAAPRLGALDQKVVALNKAVAWIERENLVYDLEAKMFIPKDAFTTGSRFSSLMHITTGGKQRAAPKQISVAKTWLTHAHAQRYGEVLFRPGEGTTVASDTGRPALNLWTGWTPEDGDVEPFLELTDFLFQNIAPEWRELPLKLMAYKAQNPAEKIPLALVLIGQQGCGKTLWGECMRDAFAPYGVDVTSKAFHSEFQGWLERSLFVLINEAEHDDMLKGGDVLKSLISDLKRPMNEKYRPARQINSYGFYCLTSNKRAVGAFSADDRRMIVVDCPPKERHGSKAAEAFYDRVSAWKRSGGPKALLGYLLDWDLKGWRPPAAAPLTPEKYMSYIESLTPTQRLAEEMRTASENTIKMWLDQAVMWARVSELSNNPSLAAMARATIENVQNYQLRPWYTPEELALMFPAIVQQALGSKHNTSTPAGVISRELREAGVPYLACADDPRGFRWRGAIRQYLVVSGFADWAQPLRQADFERLMKSWPTYGAATGRRAT